MSWTCSGEGPSGVLSMGKRYWEGLVEGERFTCRPVAFDREGIIAFGKEYDPLPFHADGDAARRSIFGDVIASALHTISACTRVVLLPEGDDPFPIERH